jgi:ribosomal-protein-alanine N-acetyltransferase
METERLFLRNWRQSDAEALFDLAKDPEIGPRAGWLPHQSVAESQTIITEVLGVENTYAICLKNGRIIGSVGIMPITRPFVIQPAVEIGYWIGQEFWGHGYTPEAVAAIIDVQFAQMPELTIWAGYYEGNQQSWRVQEKCGFVHQLSQVVDLPLFEEQRTEHFTSLSYDKWQTIRGNFVKGDSISD